MSDGGGWLHGPAGIWRRGGCFGGLAAALVWAAGWLAIPGAGAAEPSFRIHQIADSLGVGYAVALVDLNADERLDIVVVDQRRVIWFENPTWREHLLIGEQTRPDNVCIAPYDVDGDGQVDFALGADWRPLDTGSGGTIQWLSAAGPARERWQVHPIGEEPTVHRMRWADLDGNGRAELVVVPLMGRGTTRPLWNEQPLRILAYSIPDDPRTDEWPMQVINEELHVAHNFWPTDLDGNGDTEILVASYEGVSLLDRAEDGTWTRRLIGRGNQETMPDRGASEIRHGKLQGGKDYIATIEPWHGFQVVVYTPGEQTGDSLWQRQVLDEDLKWGHALWCADLDGDADEELIVGVRDDKDDVHRRGLRIYDPQADGWQRHVVDPGSVAIEDLAAGDLDGDGRIDIVAVGRQTHNARIYFNQAEASGPAEDR